MTKRTVIVARPRNYDKLYVFSNRQKAYEAYRKYYPYSYARFCRELRAGVKIVKPDYFGFNEEIRITAECVL